MENTINWNFDNSYSRLPDAFKEHVKPVAVKSPELVIINESLAKELELNFSKISRNELSSLFTGNSLPNGSNSIAQAYAGHQFGHFTMLGDGRAVLIGEHITPKNKRYDIQFKGSGKTSFSRNGDGRAALGPMFREYIISEAIHYLNIPTTRSLAVAKTGEKIIREKPLIGAVLTRVASSHIRVGTFQYIAARDRIEEIKTLLNYVVKRHYPQIDKSKDKALRLLEIVMNKQVDLVVNWMRVGFIHGVMNTDNMSVSGETIDYGPCAFIDIYNPKTVFSSIDKMGRYSFENQPKISLWNLARLGETILHLIDNNENEAIKIIEEILNKYSEIFNQNWHNMMSKKLNLNSNNENKKIIKEFLDLMHIHKLDYTNTFLGLENNTLDKKIFYDWIIKYNKLRHKRFNNVNPVVIPRNHIIEKIINESYKEDFNSLFEFEEILKNPYNKNIEFKFQKQPTDNEKVFETFCGT